MSLPSPLILATRSSQLALWQANLVKQALLAVSPNLSIQFLELTTTGDKIQHKPLSAIGGKGLFIKELEAAVLAGRAHIAVHSMKDVPNDLATGLIIPAFLERGDPRDAFLSTRYSTWQDLPHGARVGTSSVRRTAQLLKLRPDLLVHPLRGNVDTRVKKMLAGEYDAVVLAAAGLQRLGLALHIKQYFALDEMLPSVSQGAIGVECHSDNVEVIDLLKKIHHLPTAQCVAQERAFTKKLNGDCASPIAVHAQFQNDEIYLQGLVASVEGQTILRGEIRGEAACDLGIQLAEQLLSQGADRILFP